MSEGRPSASPDGDGVTTRRFGPYTVTQEIGRGAMGVVYRAHDPTLDRSVAIKVLPSAGSDATYTQRLLREARAMGHIDHPHILGVHAAGREGDQLYVVMPLITGESLAERLAREERLSLAEALRITRETASALQAASAAGIVHRDIKPDNLLLDAQGHVKVADFGLCRDLNATHSLTVSSDYVGTPRYSAPEQWLNKPLDGRADIFSLGVCLYEMLTGRPAFDASSLATLMQQVLDGDVPPVELERPDLPEEARALLRKMMAPDPDDRFRDAGALINAIDALPSQTAAPAPPDLTATVAQPGVKVAQPPRPSAAPPPRDEDDARGGPASSGKQGAAIAVACMLGLAMLAGPRLLSSDTRRLESSAPVATPAATAATAAAAETTALPLKIFVSDFQPKRGAPPDKAVEWLRVAGPDLMMEALRQEKEWLSTIPREVVELTRRQRFSKVSPDDPVGLREVAHDAGARLLLQVTYGPGLQSGTIVLTGSLYDFDTKSQIETFSIDSASTPTALLKGLQRVTARLVGALAKEYHINASRQSRHEVALLMEVVTTKDEITRPRPVGPPEPCPAKPPEPCAPEPPGASVATPPSGGGGGAPPPSSSSALEALTLYNQGLEEMAHSDDPKMLRHAWKCFDGAVQSRTDFEQARRRRDEVQTMLASKPASASPPAAR